MLLANALVLSRFIAVDEGQKATEDSINLLSQIENVYTYKRAFGRLLLKRLIEFLRLCL